MKRNGSLLVGSTGFVGGALLRSHAFDMAVHSTDRERAYGAAPELCVYAGVPSAMYFANEDPAEDLRVMERAIDTIRQIRPQKLVLISTIMVYADSRGRDEDDIPSHEGLRAYGSNRLRLEEWVREEFPDALIVRLPALYGPGLKKNFLYDLHSIVPAALTGERYAEQAVLNRLVAVSYEKQGAFYKLKNNADVRALREYFKASAFNALSFTDSRSRFQYYDVRHLWRDIELALRADLTTLNISPAPVSASEVYEAVIGRGGWNNFLKKEPLKCDMRSKYADMFGGADGHFCTTADELKGIVAFMREWKE